MENLTGFQRDLLYIIGTEDKPSGQDIRRNMETYYDNDINHGRLYPNLDELVNRELVFKGTKDQRTNYYQITDEGKTQIQKRNQWLNDVIDSSPEQMNKITPASE